MARAGREFDREILRLAIPALGSLIAEPLYILADTAVVGHLGTPQLGGLAVASTILLTGYSVFIFLAYGTTGAVARLIGAGDEREAAHQGVQGLWLAALLSVPLAVATAIWAGPLVRLIGADGDVAVNAEIYLRLSAPGIPALLLALAGTGYIRGLQDTRTPLLVAVGTSLLNLVLEVLFVYGLDLGIGASAVATVIAQWTGAVVYLAVIARSVRRRGVGAAARSPIAGAPRPGGPRPRDPHRRAPWRADDRGGRRDPHRRHRSRRVPGRVPDLEPPRPRARRDRDRRPVDGRQVARRGRRGSGAGDGAADDRVERRVGPRARRARRGDPAGVPEVFSDDPAVIALAGFMLWHVAALQPARRSCSPSTACSSAPATTGSWPWAMVGAFAAFGAASVAVLALDLGAGWLMGTLWVLMLARLGPLFARFRQDRWLVTGAAAA